ncbi:ribonuclease HI family protein [Aminivibrio sp.]|jgi:ribonuclease HI|uniref:ribonuclease HI family protein n=1 Tax=Aminivibrio sp. TaxID=1872489 RepID=UPI001D5CCD11|nr:ribonuclease HI family protein [Synergistaceae bacterium]MDD4021416.1 ribonuclease HI family protein [Synergistaceae bacterium]MDD4612721.1 ribonuclease HI family protein [Synergistaceae bacterium]NCC56429.1 ribonuclease HI family protein [Synergistales bacterium]
MRKKTPETASSQWLDLDSDWTEYLLPQPAKKPRIRGHFDGASRGNPGEAGAGAVLLKEDGTPLWECAQPLGKRTNNEAEYLALILLLEEAERRSIAADIRGDSQLVVNQVTGKWKINEPRLRQLADRAVDLLKKTKSTLAWVPREENTAADRLSNVALDGEPEAKPQKKSAPKPPFDPAKLEKVTDSIFIAHGTEDYAVDLLHEACTCPAFQRSRHCKHLDAALRLTGK